MLRTPILMKKLDRDKIRGKLVIGLLGTNCGAGVTHFGLMMAHYFSEYQGQKTAFIECGYHNELEYLQRALFQTEENSYNGDFFRLGRITFYKNLNLQKIPEVVGGSYDCVILDLGTDMAKHKGEFLRCDKKVVVCSLAIWKQHELENFINNSMHIQDSNQWIYVSPFTTTRIRKEAVKKLGRTIYGIPYEPDPFFLSEEMILFFQKIL
ncbi:MAG: SAM-dependent methyltransferase [Lachnoclostridium sp.]|jgi:hypothetical protein